LGNRHLKKYRSNYDHRVKNFLFIFAVIKNVLKLTREVNENANASVLKIFLGFPEYKKK
jgi:hypothetical protein